MKAVFADTFYFLALLSTQDAQHERAKRFRTGLRVRIVTTDWVLTELADAMSSTRRRAGFATVLNLLVEDPDVTIVPANDSTWSADAALFGDRLDKEWSLTDCISFVVMTERGIREALTGDHHFEQAGFVALLK